MGRDKYKVEILHYNNPHLLWVLVAKEGEDSYYFEQIGIYGVLPLNVTIDYEGNVDTKRCKEWLPAVYVAMKKVLLDAAEVWFSVTFLDRTTSIFNDNVHKYGDLTIRLKNGETVSMLQRLLDTGFVTEDIQYFHQGLLTKLDYVTTVSVINKIKDNLKTLNIKTSILEDILDRQTTVFQKMVELEQTSPRELDVGVRANAHFLIQKQINNLNLCKDVDEEDEQSAGRANSGKTNRTTAGLMNKLDMLKNTAVFDELKASMVKNKSVVVNQVRQESLYGDQSELPKRNVNKVKKAKVPNNEKKMMAFGPPGLNPTKFHLTEVKEQDNKTDNNIKEVEKSNTINNEDEHFGNEKLLEKEDSETSVRSNYLDILKMKSKYKKFDSNHSSPMTLKEKKCETKMSPKKSGMWAIHRKMKFLEKNLKTDEDSSSTAKTDSSARQGSDVVKRTGSTYTLHMDQKTWRQAKHACADDDGHLVILNDEAEAKVVFDMMKPLDLDFVAIGLRGEKGENTRWNYINGYASRALFNKWFQDDYEPKSPYNRCGFLNNAGRLADLSCTRPSYYVCEKENV